MAFEPLQLTDFQLGGALGSGATSNVFAATHRSGREVAIKMLEPTVRDSAELRMRLQREAIVLAGVDSPYVGKVFGFGHHDEQPFLVLERLYGETLAGLLKREGRVPFERLAVWIEQLLTAVRDCHAVGIIHRDIKPANIFLALEQGGSVPTVKLIDFGVARLKEIAQQGRSITNARQLLGSTGYMAPEQFQNAKIVGPQADVYAIGVVLFRSIASRLPFVSRSLELLVKMKVESFPPLLSSMPGVARDEKLDAFVETALAPRPSSRFDDGRQMLEAWSRVVAEIKAGDVFIDGVDVVFEFEDELEISVEATTGRMAATGETSAELDPDS